ncbi:hypothetical protein Tco_1501584 [Tanacetum coccineum]
MVYIKLLEIGSTKKSWCDEFEALMKSRFQMSYMGELTFFLGLQVKQKEDGIFITFGQDKSICAVDVHLYRSMIGSLMYLTASRPDIMFAVCAYSRFQVTPKTSHLHDVKRIFRYLRGKPKLGLWYPRVGVGSSHLDLEAYSDSDYAGVNLDRKSTTRGCQFLGRRLISWQCKKPIIMATSTTKVEYVAAANYCRQRRYHVFCTNLSNLVLALETSKGAQAAKILKLKTRIKKLKRKCQPVISHHKAWLRSVSRLSMKKKLGKKESVSKQGRKNAKSGPSDDMPDDLMPDLAHGMDGMEIEEAVNEGRQSNETEELNLDADTEVIAEDKRSGEKGGSTVSTARPEVSTARPDVGTARQEIGTADPITPPTTTTIFNDEEMTLADTLDKMKDNKAKGVVFKDIKELVRPARSVLTLKPLPSIDLKDKGKGVLEEPEPAKKMTRSDFDAAQVARDAEVARQLEVELQGEVKRERQREEQASIDYIANLYDEVQERIDVDHELAVRLNHEEHEKYTVDERAKLLAEFFERRKKQLVEERAVAIRNKPPTRTKLRKIQALYIKEQERTVNFVPIGSEEDERLIQKMNKKAASVHVEKVLEESDSTKVDVKQEVAEQGTRKTPGKVLKMKARKKRKGGPRMKRQSKRKKIYFDLEEEEHIKTFLKIVPDEEGIIDFEVLEKRFPIINWESKFYHFDRHGAECIYYRIFRSDGSSRWIKTFSEMMFETTTPEGVDLVLWRDLRTMFKANAKDELWQNKKGWNHKSWDIYENYGVHTLTLEDDTEIHMLAEKRYSLTKETLERMMSLKLIAESASDSAYDLLRFIQKQIDEAGSHDGGEKDQETTSGKDFSNPLMADSLPKTIWLSMYHVVAMKHWLFQSKWLLGRIVRNYVFPVSLDLSRLATTLNRLERSYQTGIYKELDE